MKTDGTTQVIPLAAILFLLLSLFSLPPAILSAVIRLPLVKMLPFDNKSEFQVILDLPEGSTLEQTSRVALEMARVINGDPAVVDYQVYVGTASPYNFNGLVRPAAPAAGAPAYAAPDRILVGVSTARKPDMIKVGRQSSNHSQRRKKQ